MQCALEEEGLCMQEHGAALLKRQANLMEGAVAALDGEGDPRCLLLGFQAMRELSCLYTQHDPEVRPALVCPSFGLLKGQNSVVSLHTLQLAMNGRHGMHDCDLSLVRFAMAVATNWSPMDNAHIAD